MDVCTVCTWFSVGFVTVQIEVFVCTVISEVCADPVITLSFANIIKEE